MAMCFGERSYYTAPIKALVSEKFFNLVELLGRDNVGMITGDVHINVDAPVICCTAEILANSRFARGPPLKCIQWRPTSSTISAISTVAGHGKCRCSRFRKHSFC